MSNAVFLKCGICGKRLIERRSDGVYIFAFGKHTAVTGVTLIPVEIQIVGSVKIKCLRSSCNAWNTFNLLS